jgi:hypothetical protein
MKSLLELIKSLYGPTAISSTIGTRTNVIRLPSGKLQKYLSTDLNIEAASDNAAKNAYNEMKELIPDVAKMNDAERLIFEGNLRRLKNKLEASGIIPKQTVAKEAEVLSMETKEPVTGESLKKLTEEQGTINPPTTVAGRLEQSAKRLEGLGKNLEQEFSKSKRRSASEILDEYFSSYRTMQSIEDEGLVRAVARQIMYADLNAGRLKVPKEVEDTIRGMTAKDVLDDFSQWYGAAALEDLFDNAQKFYRMESPQEAIKFLKQNTSSNWENVYQPREKPIKEYMEPEEFKKMMENATINRVGIIVPKGSEKLDNATAKEIYDFYLKTGDRKLIQEEMKSISEGTKFDSFATEDRNKILDILTDVLKKLGPPAVAGGVGLEYLAEKATPQIEGGTQQSLGLDYLTGMEPSAGYASGGRIGFKIGTLPKMLEFLIEKLSTEKGFDRGLLERAKPKAVQDLYVNQFGSLPSAEEVASIVNKQLKSKSSMEVTNPKTGEVTSPAEPVRTAEKEYLKSTTLPELQAEYKKVLARYEGAMGVLNPNKMNFEDFKNEVQRLAKIGDDIKAEYRAKKAQIEMKQVDLSDITQPQYTTVGGKKVLDATHPDTIQSFSDFAKATDPEGYAEFSKRVDRINELSTMRRNQNRFEQYSLEDYKKLGSERISELLKDIKNPSPFLEEERNVSTFGGKGLKNHEDVKFKVDKETLQKHLEDLLQQKQIEEAQVELGQLKETNRKPNASGGLNYLMGL